MDIDISDEFASLMREKTGKNLQDVHIKLIAVFLRAVDTPHYRCGINFSKIEVHHNFIVFNWKKYDDIATFDFRELTQLVLFAHQYKVRIGLSAAAPNIFKVSLSQREEYNHEKYLEQRMYYHPDMDQAINSQYKTQWLQDQR